MRSRIKFMQSSGASISVAVTPFCIVTQALTPPPPPLLLLLISRNSDEIIISAYHNVGNIIFVYFTFLGNMKNTSLIMLALQSKNFIRLFVMYFYIN